VEVLSIQTGLGLFIGFFGIDIYIAFVVLFRKYENKSAR